MSHRQMPLKTESLYILALVASILGAIWFKLPLLNKDLPPYLTCDEGFFVNDVYRMLRENSLFQSEFRSGSLNSLPIYALLSLATHLGINLDYSQTLILGRLLLAIFLSSMASIFLYLASKQIASRNLALAISIIFSFNPFLISQSQQWYPDSYIVFFTTLFLYFFLQLQQINFVKAKQIIRIGFIIALGISVKHNFLIYGVITYFWLVLGSKKAKQRNLDKILFLSISISFLLINYAIFKNPMNFLRAVNGNRKIYAIEDFPRISGGFFYLIHYLVSNLGPFLFLLFAVIVFKKNQLRLKLPKQIQLLFFSSLIYCIILGLSKQVLVRNVNIISPVIYLYMAHILQQTLNTKSAKKFHIAIPFILAFSLLFNLSVNLHNRFDFGLQNSAVVAEKWIKSNLNQESFGVNTSCQGPSPAQVAGSTTIYDPKMEQKLEWYLIGSYSESPLREYFVQQNSIVRLNYRYASAYNFNDDRIFSGWFSRKKLTEYVPPDYEIIKQFNGSGEQFILLKKLPPTTEIR